MTAGAKDTLVTLQSYTATQDDYGEEVQAWSDLGQEYARVFYGRGDERRQAAVEQGEQPATFQFWSSDKIRALRINDRLSVAGSAWDIRGIAPMSRTEIEITAVRAL